MSKGVGSRIRRAAWFMLAACIFSVFTGLGTWQLYRLDYKLDLIDRVSSRVYGPPVELPEVFEWANVTRETHEYRRVQTVGTLDPRKAFKSLAVTELGSGYWVMLPLKTQHGFWVWLNAGFIEQGVDLGSLSWPLSPVSVVGLLRISEPGGGFLRSNRPDEGRWYSRDVLAMSQQVGLTGSSAPYFVDVFDLFTDESESPPEGQGDVMARAFAGFASVSAQGSNRPTAGLTVVNFPNNHLSYALTWYAMALLTAGLTFWLMRSPD